jgi:hypothetical protein
MNRVSSYNLNIREIIQRCQEEILGNVELLVENEVHANVDITVYFVV